MLRHRPISDLARAILCAAFAAALAACSSTQPVARAYRGEIVGNQGATWETVLGTPEAPPYNDWEYARLDDAMNIRTHFDEPASLDDLRRFYLHPRPDQILYFRRR